MSNYSCGFVSSRQEDRNLEKLENPELARVEPNYGWWCNLGAKHNRTEQLLFIVLTNSSLEEIMCRSRSRSEPNQDRGDTELRRLILETKVDLAHEKPNSML
jgi:hypothetical protein